MAKKRKAKQPTKQSVVRYHSDWLRLIERSGPFLSLPVLLDTFPQGPSADDRDRRVQLKQAYESWQAENRDIAVHRAWIEYVLTHGLEIPADHLVDTGHIPQNLSVRVDVHHETLTPDIALIEPEDKDDKTPATPRMLVMIVPPDQALDKKIPGKNWVASPQTRMADLVRGCNDQGITFGLLTNGEQWMLVYSKQGETASFTTWYASIWFDEKITLRAFRDLLSARRFYGDPDRTLDKLFERSADDQHEVTDQLGLQVRDAIETLVSAIDEIDRDRKRKLLAGFSEEQLYEACVTVMMRLVFLFFAEERRLLPVKESFYEQNYSLHNLFDQLQTQKNMGEEELEWAYSGWCRLLALFRAIHGGVQHDDMQLHAYGSSLFDPDRFPFLEGRPQDTKWRELESQPLPINDRTLLHVLEALKLLEVRGIGGGQRITRVMSFRELDVEDIGHIYESLLDHTAKRAKGHVLGIVGSKGKEPELSLDELEKQAKQSREDLVDYLKAESGKTPKSIEKLLDAETKIDESRLLAACGNDQTFAAQVKPFANLVRENRSGDPIIIPDGSVYVTEGTDRRSSGTHYTPKSLTEPIVQYTLEPLVYEGPAEGKPQDEWNLKTPAEILELNICDMACGSGAFLVQACRYMAERLVEAWEHIEQNTEAPADDSQTDTGTTVVGTIEADQLVVEKNGQYATSKAVRRPRITPLGELSKNDPSEELIPLDPAERMVYARRIVADRCLYGVDVNPLACEMAKLSLWLLTLAKDKPFTFLNHAIRQGDSLIGLGDLGDLLRFSFSNELQVRPLFEQQREQIERRLNALRLLRRQIEDRPSNSQQDIAQKSLMLRNVEEQTGRLTYAADLLLAACWNPMGESERETLLNTELSSVVYKFRDLEVSQLKTESDEKLDSAGIKSRFHWVLEFPEVFENGGFDGIVGNPPFMGGLKLETAFGTSWRAHVVEFLAGGVRGVRGTGDLCAYFLLRACELIREGGGIGLIATNTISEGDSRTMGLDRIVEMGCSIPRAIRSRKWPGTASLEVSQVWLNKSDWTGAFVLNEKPVEGITSQLLELGEVSGIPHPLIANKRVAFQGSIVLGKGLVLDYREGSELRAHGKNSDVVLPYMSGDDINSRFDQSPSRFVINFFDFPLNRDGDYDGPVAEDYPECLAIVEERTKPERMLYEPKNSWNKKIRTYWWHFGQYRWALDEAIGASKYVLATCRVTKYVCHSLIPVGPVFDVGLNVIARDGGLFLAVLESVSYESWVRRYGSSLETRLRYILKDCFETFPFPNQMEIELESVGKAFHDLRSQTMRDRSEGLTELYNRIHDSKQKAADLQSLRDRMIQLEESVFSAYLWTDLTPDFDFRNTNRGMRFTISDELRKTVLQRLLKENFDRYDVEVAQGLHKKKASKKRNRRKSKRRQTAAIGFLFDADDG